MDMKRIVEKTCFIVVGTIEKYIPASFPCHLSTFNAQIEQKGLTICCRSGRDSHKTNAINKIDATIFQLPPIFDGKKNLFFFLVSHSATNEKKDDRSIIV